MIMKEKANSEALKRINESDPVWTDIKRAKDIVPGMTDYTILHSGPPMQWSEFTGGQRQAVIGACLYDDLARSEEEVDQKIYSGEILIKPCQNHSCIGSLTGVYYPSMPVFVIKNEAFNNVSFCSIYEGPQKERLTYGVFNEKVKRNLDFIHEVIAPILQKVVYEAHGISLKPIISRALRMGDELHSRNTAATMLFFKTITPVLFNLKDISNSYITKFISYIEKSELFFLHLAMAASKATADSIYNIEKCSIVTAMALNSKKFGIRVSTFGNRWFTSDIPDTEGKLFPGIEYGDTAYMGGESLINETMGLGGFAQAASFPLQSYSGGTPEKMIENNQLMYEITTGEHQQFKIPYFKYRGVPIGIDVFLVTQKRISPIINMGLAHKKGGHAGAGILKAPLDCFEDAMFMYQKEYC